MSLFISSLNSGSNGNCYYVGNETEAVLVDAGISCRETEKRLQRIGLSMNKVKAIFVSHEHSDHIRGIPVLAKKYNLPVYITPYTLRQCPFLLEEQQVKVFFANEPVLIGALSVTAFVKRHDAVEPHSFTITGGGVTVGVFTDIGAPCKQLAHHFKQCHAAFLEANYDEEMLEKGNYPYHLKRRISGGHGHLSNRQALEFYQKHKPAFLSHLILAHLSQHNNCPQLVHNLFSARAAGAQVVVASRYQETPVYTISPTAAAHSVKPKSTHNRPIQISLF